MESQVKKVANGSEMKKDSIIRKRQEKAQEEKIQEDKIQKEASYGTGTMPLIFILKK